MGEDLNKTLQTLLQRTESLPQLTASISKLESKFDKIENKLSELQSTFDKRIVKVESTVRDLEKAATFSAKTSDEHKVTMNNLLKRDTAREMELQAMEKTVREKKTRV